MPYRLSESKKCVQEQVDEEWRNKKCYDNTADAKDYLTALEMNVPDARGPILHPDGSVELPDGSGFFTAEVRTDSAVLTLPDNLPSMLYCPTNRAIRAIDEATGRIEGYLAVWGSPRQTDCYDTWFDKQRPPYMNLDRLPIDLHYAHGADGDIGVAVIGKIREVWVDASGIAFRAYLDTASPYYARIVREIRAGLLSTSSGTAGHLSEFDEYGRFVNWPLAEVSLTTKPCESRMPKVQLRSVDGEYQLFVNGGLDGSQAQGAAGLGDPSPEDCGCSADASSNRSDSNSTLERGAAMADMPGLAPAATGDVASQLAALIQQYGMEAVMAAMQAVMHPGETMSAPPAVLEDPEEEEEDTREATPVMEQRSAELENRIRDLLASVASGAAGTRAVPDETPGGDKPVPDTLQQQLDRARQQIAALEQKIMGAPPVTPPPDGRDRGSQRSAPPVLKISRKYDHLGLADLIAGHVWMKTLYREGKMERPVSKAYRSALAARADSEQEKDQFAIRALEPLRRRLGRGVRANELLYSTQASGGDEWVGVYYSEELWLKVRQAVIFQQLAAKGLREITIPKGRESYIFPTEGSNPTFYAVGQSTSEDATGQPQTKLDATKPSTGQKQVTVSKIGAAVEFTGELDEDSLIDELPEQRRNMDISFQEIFDNVLINGDTDLTANTNINLIDGTPTAAALGGLPVYTLLNGFLKLALVTNTANSRDGGALDEDDFLETMKLLGTGGKHSIARTRVAFIVDNFTYHKALALAAVKTEDVYSGATLVNGELNKIWGVDLLVSEQMALANSAGKIPAAGGTLGRILLVRPDQWALGRKRQMTTEITRWARADVTELVTYARFGLAFRDNEASAVTYNLTV